LNCTLCDGPRVQLFWEKIEHPLGERKYFSCDDCGLIFVPPNYFLSAMAEMERYSSHQNSPEQEGYVNFLSRLIQPLKTRLKKPGVGLDYGCGPGPTLSKLLQSLGHHVVNYDPYFFPQDVALNRTFDFITCTEVAEHFYRPRKEFIKLRSMLKKQTPVLGLMTEILSTPAQFPGWYYHRDPTHVSFYQPQTIEWIANFLALKITHLEKNVIIMEALE